jgi:hypothetical protein
MIDDYGDGMCFFGFCGSYQVLDAEGNELAAGADFDDEESTDFCLELPVNVLENKAHNIRLYPNPANDWVRLEGLKSTDVAELLDLTGRRINSWSGQSNYQLDLAELAEGVYFVRVLTQNGEYSKRLVVKK